MSSLDREDEKKTLKMFLAVREPASHNEMKIHLCMPTGSERKTQNIRQRAIRQNRPYNLNEKR